MHTADGISIRFPRVTRIRDDKDWSTATNLDELRGLFRRKPESVDFGRLLGTLADVEDVPRKKLPGPVDTSPRKIESARTSSWDEPSTSFKQEVKVNQEDKVKQEVKKMRLARGALKRKEDECDEESPDKGRSERKKSRVKCVVKEETENPLSAKFKEGRSNSGVDRQGEDRCIDCLAGGMEGSFESSSASDSSVEDTVSDITYAS